MTDPTLLRRLDWIVAVFTLWVVLSLVLASFALMIVDAAVGLLALGTVVLVTVIGAFSVLRSVGSDAESTDG